VAEPWLSVVGIGEDGMAGLSDAARAAVKSAEALVGAERHLALVAPSDQERIAWGPRFAEGLPKLLALRGRRVVALASGDPFWFGAGTSIAAAVPADETTVHPAPSTFSLASARLRWPLEGTATLGLHARSLALVRPHLRPGARLIVLVRDGPAAAALAREIAAAGFGPSRLIALEALGGPRERVRETTAAGWSLTDAAHPLAVAIEAAAAPGARAIPRVAGLPDDLFEHDGQLTKREIRALTLSSLAPLGDETLWDIGAGAGSIGIEWLLAHPGNHALGLERDPARIERARRNALALGVPHYDLRRGGDPRALDGWPDPDAVFVGGGASEGFLARAWGALRPGGRLVVNAMTLDTEALILRWRDSVGGTLARIAVARAEPVGGRSGWRAAAPVLHWVAVK
jgi:precorrin-6Y C5,15-methyltransferase (decarboxylating)